MAWTWVATWWRASRRVAQITRDEHESIVGAAAVLLENSIGTALRSIKRRNVRDKSAANAVCSKNDGIAGLKRNSCHLKRRHLRTKNARSEQKHFLCSTLQSSCSLHHALYISDAEPAHLTEAGKNRGEAHDSTAHGAKDIVTHLDEAFKSLRGM